MAPGSAALRSGAATRWVWASWDGKGVSPSWSKSIWCFFPLIHAPNAKWQLKSTNARRVALCLHIYMKKTWLFTALHSHWAQMGQTSQGSLISSFNLQRLCYTFRGSSAVRPAFLVNHFHLGRGDHFPSAAGIFGRKWPRCPGTGPAMGRRRCRRYRGTVGCGLPFLLREGVVWNEKVFAL